jgi:hypothetical protein
MPKWITGKSTLKRPNHEAPTMRPEPVGKLDGPTNIRRPLKQQL